MSSPGSRLARVAAIINSDSCTFPVSDLIGTLIELL